MKHEEKQIMYESDEAAKLMTVTGWVSSKGRYWGKDEHMARWEGSTHSLCKCGAIKETSRIECDKCYAKKKIELFNAYPFKEWDMVTPLTLFDDDKYFFGPEDIDEYLEENELKSEDLRLVICYPNHMQEVDYSIWDDILPEDGDLPKNILDKINELNTLIRKTNPISWSPSKIRTSYIPELTLNTESKHP
jgi:hypothetical protein